MARSLLAEDDDSSAAIDSTEDFVRRFIAYWRSPDPVRLHSLLTDDVRLYQPLSPPAIGLGASRRAFEALLDWLPDLHAEVDRWRGEGNVVFIEFRLIATIGGTRFSWPVVDRFTLRGDKACERVSYFDALPLCVHILKHPTAIWSRIRSALRQRRG